MSAYGKLYDNGTHALMLGFILGKLDYESSATRCLTAENPPMYLLSITTAAMATAVADAFKHFAEYHGYLTGMPDYHKWWIGSYILILANTVFTLAHLI